MPPLDPVSRISSLMNPGRPLTLRPKQSVEAIRHAMRSLPIQSSANAPAASDGTQAREIRPSLGTLARLEQEAREAATEALVAAGPPIPDGWIKGQLLNVRNNGAEYVVTILGEEFDPRYPNRALKFDNSWSCQQFISKWYAREHHDPRAF